MAWLLYLAVIGTSIYYFICLGEMTRAVLKSNEKLLRKFLLILSFGLLFPAVILGAPVFAIIYSKSPFLISLSSIGLNFILVALMKQIQKA